MWTRSCEVIGGHALQYSVVATLCMQRDYAAPLSSLTKPTSAAPLLKCLVSLATRLRHPLDTSGQPRTQCSTREQAGALCLALE